MKGHIFREFPQPPGGSQVDKEKGLNQEGREGMKLEQSGKDGRDEARGQGHRYGGGGDLRVLWALDIVL